MHIRIFIYSFILMLFAVGTAAAQSGLDARPANVDCVALPRPTVQYTLGLEQVFASVPFASPLGLLQAPGDDTSFYVLEKEGLIKRVQEGSSQTVIFADLTGVVSTTSEQGLLGMAFHPDFQTNDLVFLSYTDQNGTSTLSRFSIGQDGLLDMGSERVILTRVQPFANHNAGHIAFGPQGLLHLALGDGGSGNDPLESGQDPHSLLGTIVRIDPALGDEAAGYTIPAGNPFGASPGCGQGEGCPEIFAWGLRNPWRFSFDAETGRLFLGDVGQGQWEEVDIVEAGDNLGWDCYEGNHLFEADGCPDPSTLTFPILEYNHDAGDCSITGGHVYRGSAIAGLDGTYLYGDFCTGRIWGGSEGPGGWDAQLLLDTNLTITAFGRDNSGELYVVDFGGTIHRLVEAQPAELVGFPQLLSETPYVDAADPAVVRDCFIPYDVLSPLWSDGAAKQRWLAIPDGTFMDVGVDGDFTLPIGAVLVKEFSLNGRRVETRLFMRHDDGDWAGYTYEWNDAQTDAALLSGAKDAFIEGVDWHFPSPNECLRCHTQAAGRSLGLETGQLNDDFTYPRTGRTANQLATYEAIDLLAAPLAAVESLPAFADPADVGAGRSARARSYLHANCSICHRPGGTGRSGMNLLHQTSLRDMRVVNVPPELGDLGIADARRVAPGDPGRSVLLERMLRLDGTRMPPLASSVVDPVGTSAVDDWILVVPQAAVVSPVVSFLLRDM